MKVTILQPKLADLSSIWTKLWWHLLPQHNCFC